MLPVQRGHPSRESAIVQALQVAVWRRSGQVVQAECLRRELMPQTQTWTLRCALRWRKRGCSGRRELCVQLTWAAEWTAAHRCRREHRLQCHWQQRTLHLRSTRLQLLLQLQVGKPLRLRALARLLPLRAAGLLRLGCCTSDSRRAQLRLSQWALRAQQLHRKKSHCCQLQPWDLQASSLRLHQLRLLRQLPSLRLLQL